MEPRRNFLGRLLVIGAASFGSSTSTLTSTQKIPDVNPGNQSAARQINREKEAVIPLEVIQQYNLEPLKGTGPWIEGEDHKYYSIDDALRVLFEISRPHWQGKRK